MDVKDIATYGTAAAVIGTGSIVGGNVAIDQATGAVSYTHLTLPTTPYV